MCVLLEESVTIAPSNAYVTMVTARQQIRRPWRWTTLLETVPEGFVPLECHLALCHNQTVRLTSLQFVKLCDTCNIGTNSFRGAHSKTECSSRGLCQRSTGKCKCFKGFEGAACQRRTCPGGPTCSGRGECKDMSKLARTATALPLRNSTSLDQNYYSTDVDGNTWDAQSMMGCVCDSSWAVGLGRGETQLPEFFGPSCEKRRCPSGDDPTTGGIDETDCFGKSQMDHGNVTSGVGIGLEGNLCHHECSGRGLCNHDTGVCTCFPGVVGSNCGTLIS